jgi:molybdopterin molybdotransferase
LGSHFQLGDRQEARVTTANSLPSFVETLDVDSARERIVAAFAPLPAVSIPLLDALGMVLAEDIVAGEPLPPFSNSAMDGYAVRSSDLFPATSASPVVLRVIGQVPAGLPATVRVEPGSAVRIMTGAPIPPGADAVVRFEETDEPDSSRELVAVYRAVRPGDNVRPVGEDMAAGDTVLTAGSALRPAEIGLLAAVGRTEVAVHRRPKVAILATGDEIVDPGDPMFPGQIRNSNSSILAALVKRTGGDPIMLGVARDSIEELKAKLAQATQTDLIITTGGVSAGDYDFVKNVLQSEGAIALWRVRIKPGKPLAFGRIDRLPLLGLPGNPVAAAVAFEQFARPAIKTMLGHPDLSIPSIQATLLDRVENRGGCRNFVRVRVEYEDDGRYVARLAGQQGSGILTSLARCNGLLVIPEELEVAEPGTILSAQMLDWNLG